MKKLQIAAMTFEVEPWPGMKGNTQTTSINFSLERNEPGRTSPPRKTHPYRGIPLHPDGNRQKRKAIHKLEQAQRRDLGKRAACASRKDAPAGGNSAPPIGHGRGLPSMPLPKERLDRIVNIVL